MDHSVAEPHDGGSADRAAKRSRTSRDGEVRPHLCKEAPASHWHAQLARRALAPRAQRSQAPQIRGRFEGPAGLQLGPQDGCSPSLRSPLAQVVDLAERDRERQRLLASWAAFLIRAFPEADFGGHRAQIFAGALVFPAYPAGCNSGGADDSTRTSPLLPYVLPGNSPAPTVTFAAEVCARPCQSAPARLPRAAVRLQRDRAKSGAPLRVRCQPGGEVAACACAWSPLRQPGAQRRHSQLQVAQPVGARQRLACSSRRGS